MRTFKDGEAALQFVMNELPWGAAAGTCRDAVRARQYAAAGMRIVSYGSTTVAERAGNPGDNFYYEAETGNGLNAWGIPNLGLAKHLPDMAVSKKAANESNAQLWSSISAGDKFDPGEYYQMAKDVREADAADVVEGNFSCGNMKVGNEYKPVVCYDLKAFDAGVAALRLGAGHLKTAVKLTPTTERRFLLGNIDSCLAHRIDYIILANTVPNSYLEKPDGSPGITMVGGGLSGRGLRPIVTGMLRIAAPAVKGTETKLIAAGGVECGASAYHYLKHGAHGFVFSTLLWRHNFNPKVAQEIIFGNESLMQTGLVDLLVKHGLPN